MADRPSTPRKRQLFIDLYRSAVILLMLEGHVFREFLPASMQQSKLFQFHELLHGLSAPAFLFGSGLTFVITTRKRWEDFHHWGVPLARRIRRLLFVLLLGLMIHIPFFSIRKILIDGTTQDYLQLFQCDVLICISVGLLSLHALLFLFKTESRFYGVVVATILATSLLTPLVWGIDFLSYLPVPVAQLFNSQNGSTFPIFPYVGFLFAGVIVSWEFTVAVEHRREREFIRQILLLGTALLVGGILTDLVPIQIYPAHDFWLTSPSYFGIRLGALMLIISGFWYLTHSGIVTQPAGLITVFGKESLFVYVLHLLVLYGSAMNPELNIRRLAGGSLSLSSTTGVFLALTAVMLVLASAWNFLKERNALFHRLLQLVLTGIFLYVLFTRDF